MDVLVYLVPIAIGLGFLGLLAFMWALRSGQFEDLDGAAERILFDEDEPLPEETDGDDGHPGAESAGEGPGHFDHRP